MPRIKILEKNLEEYGLNINTDLIFVNLNKPGRAEKKTESGFFKPAFLWERMTLLLVGSASPADLGKL
jgi:hypothetical protein